MTTASSEGRRSGDRWRDNQEGLASRLWGRQEGGSRSHRRRSSGSKAREPSRGGSRRRSTGRRQSSRCGVRRRRTPARPRGEGWAPRGRRPMEQRTREATSGVAPARRPEMRTMTMRAPPMSQCYEVSLVNGNLGISGKLILGP